MTVDDDWNGQPCDLLIALHAHKSATQIRRFDRLCPERPLVVVLTGTDVYGPPTPTMIRSLELADRLVVLQPGALQFVPTRFREKTSVIMQSAKRPSKKPEPLRSVFEICVVGHLRAVKDPFRAVLASQKLPSESKIRIVQIGAALSRKFETQANRFTETVPRYRWTGELPRWKTLQRLARSRAMVISSESEGGASVISEALVAGVPILASRVSGNVGILGADYGGFFAQGDTDGLTRLMHRCETDAAFYRKLLRTGKPLASKVEPKRELAAIRKLLKDCESIQK